MPSRAPGSRSSLLPAPRYPLCLRFGEQNLHISTAEFELPGPPAAAPLCSPLPAIPCAFVPGSKIFTFPLPDLSFSGARQAASLCSPLPVSPYAFVSGSKIFTFPPPDFALSGARRPPLFAPLSPLALVAPFRGAKSSHFSRRFSPSPAPGGRFSLLPSPRYPLWLRSGEQNLHISAAEFELPGCPTVDSLCSPLPASPCGSVSGSKIFTFPPPDLSLPSARWRRLWLVGSFGGARKSKKRCKEGLIGLPCIAFSILFFLQYPQCGGAFRPPTRTPGFHSCGVLAASRCRSSGPSCIRSGLG